MRKIFFAILLFATSTLSAQVQIEEFNAALGIPDHTPLMNKTWEVIDKMMYKVTTVNNKKVYTPEYPPALKALENKIVELPGYLVPLKSGRNHDNFMISVLPLAQCQFCGTNGIPPMVEVFMKKGTQVRFTDEPIKVKGKMVFNPKPLEGNSEIQIVDAVLVK